MSDTSVARRMVSDLNGVSRRGVLASTFIGTQLLQHITRSMRQGSYFFEFEKVFLKFHKFFRDALLVSYLYGYRRVLMLTPQDIALSTQVFKETTAFLQKRLQLPMETLRSLEREYDAYAVRVLRTASAANERALQRTILGIQQSGMHVRQGVQTLQKRFDQLGITPAKSYQLETIYRTQTQMAYAAGQHAVLQDPDIDEILWGFKYVTVGDQRVRPTHRAMEGTTLPKDDPFWKTNKPPNGWNCRCQAIPIYDEREPRYPPKMITVNEEVVPVIADGGFRFAPGELFRPQTLIAKPPPITSIIPKLGTIPKVKPKPKPRIVPIEKSLQNSLKFDVVEIAPGARKVARAIAVETDRVIDEFPKWAEYMQSGWGKVDKVSIYNTKYLPKKVSTGELVGAFERNVSTDYKQIHLATKHYTKLRTPLKLGDDVFVVEGSHFGAWRHELGHGLAGAKNNEFIAKTWIRWDKKGLSAYGKTDATEMLAESICAYTHPEYGVKFRLPQLLEDMCEKLIGKKR